MSVRTLRGSAAVVGVGESTYYKRGGSPDPEFKLALRAAVAACASAGVSPADIDGFSSFSDDRNDGARLAAALGCRELRFSGMQWGGGGGGASAALGNAAAAIATGQANMVLVIRALAQGEFGRFGQGSADTAVRGTMAHSAPFGLLSPAHFFSMRIMRFIHDHGVTPQAARSIAITSYEHAQRNPRAVMFGRPLDDSGYDSSRWITEPLRLFDCCQENDGAAALLLVAADRAMDFPSPPCYVLAALAGAPFRGAATLHNDPNYPSASVGRLAERLYEMAGVGPDDVDVVQSYENFTGGVIMSLVEHGLCRVEEINGFFKPENLRAPDGCLPLNTSGGNLAECYVHGLGLHVEAVRQIWGTSVNQVPGVNVSMATSGPMVSPTSSCIFGSGQTL